MDWQNYDYADSKYGAWTESVWKHFSGRIFLKADPQLEIAYLCAGLVVLIVSFLLVWWISKYSDALFPTADASAIQSNQSDSSSPHHNQPRQNLPQRPPRRSSRQALTQSVGEGTDPVSI